MEKLMSSVIPKAAFFMGTVWIWFFTLHFHPHTPPPKKKKRRKVWGHLIPIFNTTVCRLSKGGNKNTKLIKLPLLQVSLGNTRGECWGNFYPIQPRGFQEQPNHLRATCPNATVHGHGNYSEQLQTCTQERRTGKEKKRENNHCGFLQPSARF